MRTTPSSILRAALIATLATTLAAFAMQTRRPAPASGKAGSVLYLKVPERRLTLILMANGEGLWWGEPLDSAKAERSPFAAAFLKTLF